MEGNKGEDKWGNCNSIINKIYFFKKKAKSKLVPDSPMDIKLWEARQDGSHLRTLLLKYTNWNRFVFLTVPLTVPMKP